MRRLEIGPGPERLPGFETLNAVATPFTDHIGDARCPPFPDATFDEVYSSHCIEHVDWWEIEAMVRQWVRVLKPGGTIEIHTVDGAAMMRRALEWEETGEGSAGTWKRELHRDHPLLFATGRILNYPKKGEVGHFWMHRAILTPRYMRECLEAAAVGEIEPVAEPRGTKKHSSINMGLRGVKC